MGIRRPGGSTLACVVVGCVLGGFAVPAAAGATCSDARRPLASLSAAKERSALRCLVAQRRSVRRLPRLQPSAPLRRMAMELAADLLETGRRSHKTSDGAGTARRARRHLRSSSRGRWEVGEVLAWTFGPDATAQDLFDVLVASTPHRRILDDRRFRLGDVAVATSDGEAVAVVELARLR